MTTTDKDDAEELRLKLENIVFVSRLSGRPCRDKQRAAIWFRHLSDLLKK